MVPSAAALSPCSSCGDVKLCQDLFPSCRSAQRAGIGYSSGPKTTLLSKQNASATQNRNQSYLNSNHPLSPPVLGKGELAGLLSTSLAICTTEPPRVGGNPQQSHAKTSRSRCGSWKAAGCSLKLSASFPLSRPHLIPPSSSEILFPTPR